MTAVTIAATITVYTKPACSHCETTTRILDRKNISYRTVDLTGDSDALDMVTAHGHMAAPVVVTATDEWAGLRMDKLAELSPET